jgi:soluble P-type ATPase
MERACSPWPPAPRPAPARLRRTTSAASRSPACWPSSTGPRPTRAHRSPSSTSSASQVKVITVDNSTVAVKVCRDIGVDVEGVRTGAELERLDDAALRAAIPHTTVFARVSPDHKSRIIKLARAGGADVAFLGDGVNDAVAPHAADVGLRGVGDRRGQGGRRHRAARQGPRSARRRRDGGTAHLCEHPEVRPDGDVVELREHVQRRGRVLVPVVPADAADAAVADPAQRPALRRRPARHPHRPRRCRGPAPTGWLGHRVRAPLHGRLRTRQFAVRLHDLLGHARRPGRRAPRVSARAGSSSRSPRRLSSSSSSAPAACRSCAADRAER